MRVLQPVSHERLAVGHHAVRCEVADRDHQHEARGLDGDEGGVPRRRRDVGRANDVILNVKHDAIVPERNHRREVSGRVNGLQTRKIPSCVSSEKCRKERKLDQR